MELDIRNVNYAYAEGVNLITVHGIPGPSRDGEVLVFPEPVRTAYMRPTERVLFHAIRDANPAFHLFEALWMLAGRDDAKWLDRFIKDFSARFTEADERQHGAYGYRWRHAFGFDQLNAIVEKLRKNPDDRQAVLQMWDCRDESIDIVGGGSIDQTGQNDLRGQWKDRPCNTTVYFRVRTSRANVRGNWVDARYLDMTVCCRSNDIIMGAYGANAVHFSVLQEYMAARIGVGVGIYYQFSNNYHAYKRDLDKFGRPGMVIDPYTSGVVAPAPMVTVPEKFDYDLKTFMEWTDDYEHGQVPYGYHNDWFSSTAEPLFAIAERWRAKDRATALALIDDDVFDIAPDWRLAMRNWMHRRMDKLKEKSGA